MSVLHVERVSGRYIEPEIVDLDDGCLFRIHKNDVGEAGAAWLARVFSDITQTWAMRPADAKPGPVVPVRFERDNLLPEPIGVIVNDTAQAITYTVSATADILTERAAAKLSRLATERTPRWWRIPQGYRERLNGGS